MRCRRFALSLVAACLPLVTLASSQQASQPRDISRLTLFGRCFCP